MAPTPRSGPDPLGAVFITRLTTANKGNEALSGEWIRLLRGHLPQHSFSLAPRVPDHLLQFSLDRLGSGADAQARFARWADSIVVDWRSSRPAPAQGLAPIVKLDERQEPAPTPLRRLKRQLNIRARLARFGAYRNAYLRRLSAFEAAGCVILNPAGEFWTTATDIPLRHLLDIYVARQLGCRTAIVNHTFELVEPRLLEVAKLVYGATDLISVREETSKRRLADLGVDPAKILIAPDFVFMTEPAASPARPKSDRPRVAVCPNSAYLAKPAEAWGDLVAALVARGCEVTLVTNDLPIDRDTLDRLSARFGLAQQGAGLSYRDYAGLLGSFDAVISSRLHSGVMALTAGTPLIPVEGLDFKITAAMAGAGVPIPAVRPGEGDWVDRVTHSLETILADPAAARSWTADVVARQRHGVESFLGEVKTKLGL